MRQGNRSCVERCLPAIVLVGSLLTAGCKGSDGSSSVSYEHQFKGAYESTSTAGALTAQTVNFDIGWNEVDGKVDGFYQDDYFATTQVAVSGTVADGKVTFTFTLPAAKDGVSTIEFVITEAASGRLASITGKSSAGALIFADSDVALEKTGSGTAAPQSADAFFELVAGEYEWVATRTGGSDAQWNEGETYKVTIGADKKISLPSNDGAIEIVFGSETTDKFESYDHEAYIVAQRGDCEYRLQHQYEGKATFLVCAKGNEMSSPFWNFSAKGGTSTGVLADLNIGGAAGDHAWVVISAGPAGLPNLLVSYGEEFKFKIDADANITSPVGDFTYADANFSQYPVSSDGKQHYNSTWYAPSKTAVPRKEFVVEADAEKLISVLVKEVRSASETAMYVIAAKLPGT